MAVMALLLVASLSLAFRGTFVPDHVLFSNDGPLGRLMSQCHRLPDEFTGCWQDLNVVGYEEGSATPSISCLLRWCLGPLWFSKLYAPTALLILGLSAWFFFRQSGLAPPACVLGGLAAAFNASFFSAACWGVAAHPITLAMTFAALGILADTSARQRWLRLMLAGFAVGMGVTEGADIGAILSLFVAAFLLYQSWIGDSPAARRVAAGLGQVALVALCAAFLACQAISALVATNIKDVVASDDKWQTDEGRWDWATQWSLPKREALGLVVPALFGYRTDILGGGAYWGKIGRDAAWDRYMAAGATGPQPKGFTRFSGGGIYAGVPVALVAFWAAVQSLRSKRSVFSLLQRRLLWFWLAAATLSLLLAFGRYAPFYYWVYDIPYFSNIRNPVKFLDVLSLALVVLFGYGLDSLWRGFMESTRTEGGISWSALKKWWTKAGAFEKVWVRGCVAVLGGALLAWLLYSSSRDSLIDYLVTVQIDEASAPAIASFSINQVGWFVLVYGLSAGLMGLILSGAFSGVRARWGLILFGLLLVADLGHANQPWIMYWNCRDRYTSNSILDTLRPKPYEQRVMQLPFRPTSEPGIVDQLFRVGWLQHQFPYYNIQSLDVAAMSRVPRDINAFEDALNPPDLATRSSRLIRRCQLTNTRYLVGSMRMFDFLDQNVDPEKHRFRVVERFDVRLKPGIQRTTSVEDLVVEPGTDGACALFEFTGALPRARLYLNWQISTNETATLEQLVSNSFDPESTVLVAGGVPPPQATTHLNPGPVEFASYSPKQIVLKCEAPAASVLLLNDHFDPNWTVQVDGKAATLLRCNFLMRGVYLTPGSHTVRFGFRLPTLALSVSLAAIGLAALVLGILTFTARPEPALLRLPTPDPLTAVGRQTPKPPGNKVTANVPRPPVTPHEY